jgi:DNA polymerase-3 subunit epsilon
MSLDFVAIDFETANPKRASVIQIGLTRILDSEVRGRVSRFVTPPPGHERFDRFSVQVHGLTARSLVNPLSWPDAMERLGRFANGLPLVAHAATVERSIIVQASEAHGIQPLEFQYFCSLKLAQKMLPGEPSHSLGKLSASIGLPQFNHHDACADAEASGMLLLEIARRLGVNSLEEMPVGWVKPSR